jgi:hypothetical protein
LRGEDGGDEELPRVGVVKRARGGREHDIETAEDLGDAGFAFGRSLGTRDFRVSS